MIIEFLIIFLAWAAIATVIAVIVGLPVYWGILIAPVLLMIYDSIIPDESRRNLLQQRVGINDIIPALQNLGFFLLVAIVDVGVLLSTFYLEAGGAKLAFPNFKWPKEIAAVFALIGIPPQINFPAIWGLTTTTLLAIANFVIIRHLIAFLSTLQGVLLRKRQWEELYSLFQPLIIAIIVAIIAYAFLFPWMANLAKIQIAKVVWPADFQPNYQGEEIQVVKVIPDLNHLLEEHKGEFWKGIVIGLPYVMVSLHLLAGILTEFFLLHVQMNLSNLIARHDQVIFMLRSRLMQPFSRQRQRPDSLTSPTLQVNNPDETSITSVRPVPESERSNLPSLASEPEKNIESIFDAEETSPEDQPVRVMGSSESITPRKARQHPDLYVVEQQNAPETSYRIYIREFYETLQQNPKEVV